MIRKHKTTIFTDAKENTSVAELKRMLEGKQSTTSLELKQKRLCMYGQRYRNLVVIKSTQEVFSPTRIFRSKFF